MLGSVARAFSDDIAVDLGTANTLVHVVGRGIIIDEPSVVAVRTRDGIRDILAVGLRAKAMLGKTPEPIELLRPMRDGVIADFVATEAMLSTFLKRTKRMLGFRAPRVLICVPSGATPLERRAVHETAKTLGARKVYLIEEPVAAALGAGLPIDGRQAYMVVDIGGGTSDIAVVREGRVLASRSLRLAGNAMDEAIVRYVRREHHLLISEASAERIKIEAGAALPCADERDVEVHIKGRELREGRPRSALLGRTHVAAALQHSVRELSEFVQRAFEDLPRDVAADIANVGIVLTGGGAQLERLDQAIARLVGVRVAVPAAPMHCVIRGTAVVLEGLDRRRHLLLQP